MKITKNVLIALLAFVIGVVGLVVCLTPSSTAPDKTVARYVKAINSGNVEKMNKCMITASEALGEYAGELGEYADMLGSAVSGSQQVAPGNEVYSALMASELKAASRLPEGVTDVKKVELCGCADGEIENYMNMTGLSVNAVVKVTYVDAEGEEQSFYSNETLGLVKSKGSYKIAG